jgi:alkanesulfonate monooxygenase SsuD/methylene tetrahydromethanopterin reductase-like flavin-dependent oxidoreductase (luciferase family)
MRFGLFGGAQAPRTTGGDLGRGFREYIDTSVEAERLGFYSTFPVEHHFSRVGSGITTRSWWGHPPLRSRIRPRRSPR